MIRLSLKPSEARIWSDIEALSKITNPERPWTRRPFTALYEDGRAWLKREMDSLGLDVYQDAASNVIGRLAGRKPE
ncbi:Zn-dependent hydrolase, partial [Paenibacillus sp. MCAF20]